MSGDHSLGPDRDTEKFDGFVRMEQHPDGEPGGAKTMDSAQNNPGDANSDFLDREWIYGSAPCLLYALVALKFCDAKQRNRVRSNLDSDWELPSHL